MLHFPAREKLKDFTRAINQKLRAGDFNFQGVWFPEEASFTGPFTEDANFAEAVFSEDINFNLTFMKTADFSLATFEGTANFNHAEFVGAANFGGVTFAANADFMDAAFRAKADLVILSFSQRLTFRLPMMTRQIFNTYFSVMKHISATLSSTAE